MTCGDQSEEPYNLLETEIWSKIMTRDVHNPKHYKVNETMAAYFTNRMRTGVTREAYHSF